ncbi:hypothetical protein KCU71_g17, partial [Aureobasidium melanogenum]
MGVPVPVAVVARKTFSINYDYISDKGGRLAVENVRSLVAKLAAFVTLNDIGTDTPGRVVMAAGKERTGATGPDAGVVAAVLEVAGGALFAAANGGQTGAAGLLPLAPGHGFSWPINTPSGGLWEDIIRDWLNEATGGEVVLGGDNTTIHLLRGSPAL